MNQALGDALRRQLDSLSPRVSDHLKQLGELPVPVQQDIIAALVSRACQSQHVGNITIARNAIAQIPPTCLRLGLPAAIQKAVNFADEWEYRRLLELLQAIDSDLLDEYVQVGLSSTDMDIREA